VGAVVGKRVGAADGLMLGRYVGAGMGAALGSGVYDMSTPPLPLLAPVL
jgi:hypothetical protein